MSGPAGAHSGISKGLGSIGVTSLSITGFIKSISTVSEDQLAVDEMMIRLQGQKFWLYGGIDPQTNEILHVSLYPTTNKQMTQWSLTDSTGFISLMTWNFLLMTQTLSDQFSLKMAINFKPLALVNRCKTAE